MQQALLFLPDISGFTSFIKDTEIRHSKHIIKELLELLLDQNEIGLQLAEIEGDALFFYRLGEDLTTSQLAAQIEKMYRAFHEHLLLYRYKRICNCGACTNANGLKLKFIVHEADIEFIEIKDTRKPFGEEVIKAHRLLKNKVPLEEYVLFSPEYLSNNTEDLNNIYPKSPTTIQHDFDFGDYSYYYVSLDHIPKGVTDGYQITSPELGRQILASHIDLKAEANQVFQFILDFEHRDLWNTGADKAIFQEGEINQVGSKHTCLIGGGKLELTTIFKDENEDELVFIESTDDAPVIGNMTSVFRVSPKPQGCRLDIQMHTKSNSFLGKLMTPLLRMKLRKVQKSSLAKLQTLVEN